jgi:hypothetical protein
MRERGRERKKGKSSLHCRTTRRKKKRINLYVKPKKKTRRKMFGAHDINILTLVVVIKQSKRSIG